MPRRVKVQGDLFHGSVPVGAVYVGRAAPGLRQSPFRNQHRVGKPCRECGGEVHTLREALDLFEEDFLGDETLLTRARAELAGWDLACWCRLPEPGEPDLCHAALMLGPVNEPRPRAVYPPGPKPYGWPVPCHVPAADVTVQGGLL
ncbi:DUF4326 domain-containing protein [Actinomadura decatromicini]|uniref:DUF4326 domain-containing protein n=1 Tax=Actinomadura decatromicini TaxID=2604572 RepID=A0A5D3FAT4_9ACTN|nr:DUF4326 domain-containing protein [Actinomadura decatromicini]TYK45189.1 DUF4326 domain-containing protein [Actinomadura decatromicini]